VNARDENLLIALEAAVPLHIIEIRNWTSRQRQRFASEAATVIGSQGDVLQYGGGKRGDVANVFNHLARGLACAAYQIGGVTFADHHWCTDHTVCEGAEDAPVAEVEPKPTRVLLPVVDLELPA
jgi:hypothetical protein